MVGVVKRVGFTHPTCRRVDETHASRPSIHFCCCMVRAVPQNYADIPDPAKTRFSTHSGEYWPFCTCVSGGFNRFVQKHYVWFCRPETPL